VFSHLRAAPILMDLKKLPGTIRLKRQIFPEFAIIPLFQHIGNPCEPIDETVGVIKMKQKTGDRRAAVFATTLALAYGAVKGKRLIDRPKESKCGAVGFENDLSGIPVDLLNDLLKPLDEILPQNNRGRCAKVPSLNPLPAHTYFYAGNSKIEGCDKLNIEDCIKRDA
jgi:hypothetical protein